MNLIYRGSDPAPKHEHGETISGYGVINSRRRLARGWEYGCYSNACNMTLYVYEPDEIEGQTIER